MNIEPEIPPVVSIRQMCQLLGGISRSRFYQMIAPSPSGTVGMLYPPIFTLDI